MKKTGILIIAAAALVISAGALFAADFELVYKVGLVEVQKGARWTEVADGDAVPADGVIRLGNGAVAEFSGSAGTVVFSRPGTYNMAQIAGAARDNRPTAVSSITDRMKKIGGKGERGQVSVMGVRASSAARGPEVTWVEEDAMAFDEAVAAFGRTEYSRAAEILENEVDPAALGDETAYRYYLAAAYFADGKKGPALRTVLAHKGGESSVTYGDYLFLKGVLLGESLDYAGAAEHFELYLKTAADDADRQTGNYLLGDALLRTGDRENGSTALREAVKLDADPEITRLARERLR